MNFSMCILSKIRRHIHKTGNRFLPFYDKKALDALIEGFKDLLKFTYSLRKLL